MIVMDRNATAGREETELVLSKLSFALSTAMSVAFSRLRSKLHYNSSSPYPSAPSI